MRVNSDEQLVTDRYDGPYHIQSIVKLTNDYSDRRANAMISLNSDDCSMVSTSNLSREAEKPGVLDGINHLRENRNVLPGRCLMPDGVALQGPRGSQSHLAASRGLVTVLSTVLERLICP